MLVTVQYFIALFTCHMSEDLSGVVDINHFFPQVLAYPLMDNIYLGKLKVSTFDQLLESQALEEQNESYQRTGKGPHSYDT